MYPKISYRQTLQSALATILIIMINSCSPLSSKYVSITTTLQPNTPQRIATPIRATVSPIAVFPSATAITLPTPTVTQIPTLRTEDALAELHNLFKTNGNCKLPCWWGVIPGVSKSGDVFNFIHSIGQSYNYSQSQDKISEVIYFYFFDLPQELRYSPNDYFEGRIYAENGVITRISVTGFNWPSYHLSPFLLENGKPDEVWISTQAENPEYSVPFSVYLLYAKEGMLISYGTWLGEIAGTKIRACLDVSPSLLIWIPVKSLTFNESETLLGIDTNQGQYKPILDATEGKMDVEQFYQHYKDVKGVPCFETRMSLWNAVR